MTTKTPSNQGPARSKRGIRAASIASETTPQLPPEIDADLPEFSEEALALKFTAKHWNELRYVAVWGKWVIWDGKVWRVEDTLKALDKARHICRENAKECKSKNERQASAIASAKTVAAVERLAKVDRRHAATVEQWDADIWLLNTPGGIVDLQTGFTISATAEHHMTKITAAAPGGDCPQWLQVSR
jgi:putative DNA primase/helicase